MLKILENVFVQSRKFEYFRDQRHGVERGELLVSFFVGRETVLWFDSCNCTALAPPRPSNFRLTAVAMVTGGPGRRGIHSDPVSTGRRATNHRNLLISFLIIDLHNNYLTHLMAY